MTEYLFLVGAIFAIGSDIMEFNNCLQDKCNPEKERKGKSRERMANSL
jgi:hypothetical protein